jgi:DNA polymerase-3 subunit epsilon
MADIKKIVFIDTETTGLDPITDLMVEIAAVHLDPKTGEVLDAYESLVCVPKTAIAAAWQPKRFDGCRFHEAPLLEDVLKALAPMLEGATIAGQNPHFDLGFLIGAHTDAGLPMPKLDYHTIDTGSMVIPLVMAGVIPGMGLRHSRRWAGQSGEQSHRAMGDVLDCIAVFRRVCEAWPPTGYP